MTQQEVLTERIAQIGFQSAARHRKPITMPQARQWASDVLSGVIAPEDATDNTEANAVIAAIIARSKEIGILK